MTYSDEEVRELFEVVFKISAKEVIDKLILIRNKPDIAKRRWFWELLQNAKDSVKPDEKVSVRLIVGEQNLQPYVEFQHNGNPFSYKDTKNLIFPYSDKGDEVNSDKSGRFGTGFLSTHVLSNKIEVQGVFLKEKQAYTFNFTLDRSGNDKYEIAKSISTTWQEFRDRSKLIDDYNYNPNNYETSFKYLIDNEKLQLVNQVIQDFDIYLPYTLAFVPKIQKVEIHNRILNLFIEYKMLSYKTEILSENLKKVFIEKKTFEGSQCKIELIKLVIGYDGIVDIGIGITNQCDKTFINEFLEHQSLLYCSFPLIGADEFKFPVVINSTYFIPKNERDGIWLSDTFEGTRNQEIFKKVLPIYFSLLSYASSNNWQNTYLLLRSLNKKILINDFNSSWFNENIRTPMKKYGKIIPLVDNPTGERLPMCNNGIEVQFPFEEKRDKRLELWYFMYNLFPALVPKKEEVHEWYNVLWEGCPKHNIESFTKYVAQFQSVNMLQYKLQKSREETLNWLNKYISFVNKEKPALLNSSETQILPNQLGEFKKKDELYLDDGSIDEELKEILAEISKVSSKVYDWRKELLDKNIFLELPGSRTRNISQIGAAITEITKEILKEDSPTNEVRDIFSRLLNWLNENSFKAKKYFKELKTETLLYKTASESKIRYITALLQNDRKGTITLEQLATIDKDKIALLQDKQLELKVKLGEQVLREMLRKKEEFEFKRVAGNIFEMIFLNLIKHDNRLSIQKVDGEQDFIIKNVITNKLFYIELKSIRTYEQRISMTPKQAKKAYLYPNNYVLCIIPNDGELIDYNYFLRNSKFDFKIGEKLAKKVREAIAFETQESGISVEFEDELLRQYFKYRYKLSIQKDLWGQDDFNTFKMKLLSND